MPDWEGADAASRSTRSCAVFRDPAAARRAQRASAARRQPACATLANWGNKVIFDVVAPENEQYRGRMVGEIAEEQGRDAVGRARATSRVADELNTSFGTVPAPETDDDWKARVEVWRDDARGDRRVRRRRAPRPARVVQLRHRHARQGGARARAAAARGGHPPDDRRAGPALRPRASGAGSKRAGTPTWSCSTPPPSAATRSACASTCPAARRGSTPTPTASSTCSSTARHRARRRAHRRALRHPAALRPRHPHRAADLTRAGPGERAAPGRSAEA